MPEPLLSITLNIPLQPLREFMILDFVFGRSRSTSRLRSLSRNFVCVTSMMYNPGGSLYDSPLYKRLHTNVSTFRGLGPNSYV